VSADRDDPGPAATSSAGTGRRRVTKKDKAAGQAEKADSLGGDPRASPAPSSEAAVTAVRSVFEAIRHPLLFVPADGDAAG
jgi:hypothetical protein